MTYHITGYGVFYDNNSPSRELADDYVYECECGERFRSVYHAAHCRKCRIYIEDAERDGCVEDIRTGSICWSPRVYWGAEVHGADDKPRTFAPTLFDVWLTTPEEDVINIIRGIRSRTPGQQHWK